MSKRFGALLLAVELRAGKTVRRSLRLSQSAPWGNDSALYGQALAGAEAVPRGRSVSFAVRGHAARERFTVGTFGQKTWQPHQQTGGIDNVWTPPYF
jgi:hypothetical protein